MALEFMDVQEKDNTLYAALIATGLVAIGIAWVGYYYVSIVLTALIGLTIAYHLHNEKMDSMDEVVCPIGEHCYDVITSKYSDFLGVSVEILGMLYYAGIFTGYLTALVFNVPSWFTFLLLSATALALLFSAYLTWIQAVPLGQWCIWCVTSAMACIAIFSFALLGLDTPLRELLTMYEFVPHGVYVLSIAIGAGATLSADALFLNFLRDFEISESQARAIEILYEIMWTSLAFIVLGGAGYFYANPGLISEPVSLVSIIAIGVLTVNSLLLYLFTSQKLMEIRFSREEEEELPGEVLDTRKRSFMLMGVSTATWITLLLVTFAMIPEGYAGLDPLLGIYLALLLVSISAGRISESILKREAKGEFKSKVPLLFD